MARAERRGRLHPHRAGELHVGAQRFVEALPLGRADVDRQHVGERRLAEAAGAEAVVAAGHHQARAAADQLGERLPTGERQCAGVDVVENHDVESCPCRSASRRSTSAGS